METLTQVSDNHQIFFQTAQHWATSYAGGKVKNPEYEKMIDKLKDMGFEEGPARVALSSCSWDINRATEQLFN